MYNYVVVQFYPWFNLNCIQSGGREGGWILPAATLDVNNFCNIEANTNLVAFSKNCLI